MIKEFIQDKKVYKYVFQNEAIFRIRRTSKLQTVYKKPLFKGQVNIATKNSTRSFMAWNLLKDIVVIFNSKHYHYEYRRRQKFEKWIKYNAEHFPKKVFFGTV